MINEGKFQTTLNSAADLLGDLGLLKERNSNRRQRLGAAELAGLDYQKMWEAVVAANDYDIRLEDESILAFWRSSDGKELRYWWFEAPMLVPHFDDYARDYLKSEIELNDDQEGLIAQWRAEFEEEIRESFEQDVRSAPLRESVTPLRYEYQPRDYTEGLHPASHLHVGNANSIRFACRRVLTPLSFVLMVLRQCYPDCWKRCLDGKFAETHKGDIRDGLLLVEDTWWRQKDTWECWLE